MSKSAFHQELGHIKAIGGSAEGRLVLGESLLSVKAKVDISKMKFSANYDRVPLPLTVDQGSFSYDEKGVSVKNLAGTIGTSAIFRPVCTDADRELLFSNPLRESRP